MNIHVSFMNIDNPDWGLPWDNVNRQEQIEIKFKRKEEWVNAFWYESVTPLVVAHTWMAW